MAPGSSSKADERPNILLAISDDQSFAHTSISGFEAVETPTFDRIAREGVLFTNAICSSPGCSPSRASLLTGRYPWQLEQAGTHASEFPGKFDVYPDLLEQVGYVVGYTGKAWGPGNWMISGRTRNPAGNEFNAHTVRDPKTSGISKRDYVANFQAFLETCPEDRPFCYWYGGHEPHRVFEKGSGERLGKRLDDVTVPEFLPDSPEIRSDILDYCVEIEYFDEQLGRMMKLLEDRGRLNNTLVVVTSDNGMAFPRAKANCYEYGVHVPLAMRWPKRVPGARVVRDLVSFVDLAPTFLEAARLMSSDAMIGQSLMSILESNAAGLVDSSREFVCSARERHSSSRWKNLTYPQRALRTQEHLLIRNLCPERWPAGAPQELELDGSLGPLHGGYYDIDVGPSLSFLIKHRDSKLAGPFFHLAVDKRPSWELFNIVDDPGCVKNLANDPDHADTKERLSKELLSFLKETSDPRVSGGGDVFENYKRYSKIRKFPPPTN